MFCIYGQKQHFVAVRLSIFPAFSPPNLLLHPSLWSVVCADKFKPESHFAEINGVLLSPIVHVCLFI